MYGYIYLKYTIIMIIMPNYVNIYSRWHYKINHSSWNRWVLISEISVLKALRKRSVLALLNTIGGFSLMTLTSGPSLLTNILNSSFILKHNLYVGSKHCSIKCFKNHLAIYNSFNFISSQNIVHCTDTSLVIFTEKPVSLWQTFHMEILKLTRTYSYLY